MSSALSWILLGGTLVCLVAQILKVRSLQSKINHLVKKEQKTTETTAWLEKLPFTLWQREASGKIKYISQKAFEIDKCQKIADKALLSGVRQSKKQTLVVDGERRVMQVTEIPSENGTIGCAWDATHEAKLENDLAKHISTNYDVLEQMSTGITIYGADMCLKFFNPAYVQMFGLDPAWLATQPSLSEVLDVLHERRMLAEYANFPAYKKKRLNMFTSTTEPIQDLEHLPNERTIRNVCAPHPLGGMFFMFEDVTDTLILERQYNTLTAVQKETLDHLSEGIAVIGQDSRLTLSNPAFSRFWNIDSQKLQAGIHVSELVELGKPFFNYGQDWDHFKSLMIQNITDRIPKTKRIKRKDHVVLDFSYVPLPDGGHLISYTDVTASDQIKQVLMQRNEALETADRLKSEFIAHVSYELRSPLNSIIGFTDMLSGRYNGDLNSKQNEYVDSIHQASQQLLGLINNILDLASIEAGYISLNPQVIEILPFFKNVIEVVKPQALQRRLQLNLTCSVLGWVKVDEIRLKQVVLNLLSNAIKFTPEGGNIIVTVDKTSTDFIFSVEDNGIGIARKDQRRIFEKFERGNISISSNPQGAGLGLPLVKNLIRLHGGQVVIKSRLKQGTSITCKLPLAVLKDLKEQHSSLLKKTG